MATTPDHIVPLAFGGSDNDDNIQCLCAKCHERKTAAEGATHGGAATHPAWLEPSAIPLTTVCGPPCAGKTTFLQENADASDVVIDLDTIRTKLKPEYRHWSGTTDNELFVASIRVRNAMLGALKRAERGRAWFIVSAPTEDERAWWQAKLGGEVVLLHPGIDECKRRAVARGTPKAIQGIDDWVRDSDRPWQPRVKRSPIGVDGRPTDPDHPWAKARSTGGGGQISVLP